MSNCAAAYQTQIASIMDVLAKAAVVEISKVVEDAVVVLRVETCQRQNEIEALRRNLEVVSSELRATRRALVRECINGRSAAAADIIETCDQQSAINRGCTGKAVREESRGAAEDKVNALKVKVRVKVKSEAGLGGQGSRDACGWNAGTPGGGTDRVLDRGLSHRWPAEGADDAHTGARSEPQPQHPTTHNGTILPAAVSMATSAPPTARPRLRRWWPYAHLGTRPARTTQAVGKSVSALARGSGSYSNAGLRGGQGGLWGHFRLRGLQRSASAQQAAWGGRGINKRRFPCGFCEKTFDRLSHLERHRRIHTGERPYGCSVCGRRFTQKSSLKGHLRTHRGMSAGVPDGAVGGDGQAAEDDCSSQFPTAMEDGSSQFITAGDDSDPPFSSSARTVRLEDAGYTHTQPTTGNGHVLFPPCGREEAGTHTQPCVTMAGTAESNSDSYTYTTARAEQSCAAEQLRPGQEELTQRDTQSEQYCGALKHTDHHHHTHTDDTHTHHVAQMEEGGIINGFLDHSLNLNLHCLTDSQPALMHTANSTSRLTLSQTLQTHGQNASVLSLSQHTRLSHTQEGTSALSLHTHSHPSHSQEQHTHPSHSSEGRCGLSHSSEGRSGFSQSQGARSGFSHSQGVSQEAEGYGELQMDLKAEHLEEEEDEDDDDDEDEEEEEESLRQGPSHCKTETESDGHQARMEAGVAVTVTEQDFGTIEHSESSLWERDAVASRCTSSKGAECRIVSHCDDVRGGCPSSWAQQPPSPSHMIKQEEEVCPLSDPLLDLLANQQSPEAQAENSECIGGGPVHLSDDDPLAAAFSSAQDKDSKNGFATRHNKEKITENDKDGRRRFLCGFCEKTFDRLSHLERHRRIHTGERPYGCSVCGRRFTQKSSLTGHLRTHTGERPYRCPRCSLAFATSSARNRHQCAQPAPHGRLAYAW